VKRSIAPAVCTVLVLFSGGALADEDPYQSALDEAVHATEAGDLERALGALLRAKAIQSAPEIDDQLGRLLADLGRYAEAVEAYRRVAEDERAPESLQRKDRARIAALEGKLHAGWLLAQLSPRDAAFYVDGHPVRPQPVEEMPLSEGHHAFQLNRGNGSAIALAFRDLKNGRRAQVALDVAEESAHADQAILDVVSGMQVTLDALQIDRYIFNSGLSRSSLWILLEPGTHIVHARLSGRGWQTVSLPMKAGETIVLSSRLSFDGGSSGEAELTRPPVQGAEHEPKSWPYVTGGIGVALTTLGIVLQVVATSERSRVQNAARTGDVITGITMREASDLESSANAKARFGTASLVIGAATIAGSLGWLFWDTE
jgi:tetratricopeptide (TPR) repeat protein